MMMMTIDCVCVIMMTMMMMGNLHHYPGIMSSILEIQAGAYRPCKLDPHSDTPPSPESSIEPT